MQKPLKYLNTNKGPSSAGLIDCSRWIKRKFTTSSEDIQGVVTVTYWIIKKVGPFGVEYVKRKNKVNGGWMVGWFGWFERRNGEIRTAEWGD